MGFIGGAQQSAFIDRIKGKQPDRLLGVPIDVGKHTAMAMVCDFYGEVVAPPFTFAMNEGGVAKLRVEVARAEALRNASVVKVGLEQAGHYHRNLMARLVDVGMEVTLLNPAQVKQNRSQNLLRTTKTDERDLCAIAELIIRGKGRVFQGTETAMSVQIAYAAHRRRKVKARSALKNQIYATADLVFPLLDSCFDDLLGTKFGRLIIEEGLDPLRIRQLGQSRLRTYSSNRGVRITRGKAQQVVDAAKAALVLDGHVSRAYKRILVTDAELLRRLDQEIERAEEALAEVLPATPANILTTIPYVAVVRASNYGAGIGDHLRFRDASQVYRASGLVPSTYESSGRKRSGGSISREGKVELREAILDIGKALRTGHPDFARYANELIARGKKKGQVACALGNRANRLAFAMMRDQSPFDTKMWAGADGRVMAEQTTRSASPAR